MQQAWPHRIRLFVIDPQPLIAAALEHLLRAHLAFEVVGTAQTVDAGQIHSLAPDLVVLCPDHGTGDLCEMVAACRDAAEPAKVCVVACHAHPELLARIFEAGADGYTIKDTAAGDLIEAIEQIYGGAKYVDPRLSTFTLRTGVPARRDRSLNHLSARETEVLKLIADGYSNREISIALSLSEKTIKNHISRIFAKLHVTARTQAVIHAIKSGIA